MSAIVPPLLSPSIPTISEPKSRIPALVECVLRVLEALSKYLARGSDEIGLTYEMTSPKGVKSYLIGTAHMVDRESIQKSAFQRIIAKCCRLYSEAGTDTLNFAPYTGLLETEEEYKHLPFHYYLDSAITLEAQHRKIPVYEVDKGIFPGLDKIRNDEIIKAQKMGPDTFQKHTIKMMEDAFKNNPAISLTINAWKARDIAYMAAGRDEEDFGLIAYREDRWMDILLPVLIKTKKPICIAVGAMHVVGYDSLTERFKTAGFIVEPITRSPPYFLERMIRKVETTIRSHYV